MNEPELNETAAAMETANLALEHLSARGRLSTSAMAAQMIIEHATERLLSDDEIANYINRERIRLGAEKLAELSGAWTLEACNV